MHYSGGRAQMAQDYMDQLKNGSYLLNIQENMVFDSIEQIKKRAYKIEIQTNSKNEKLRKFSSIKEYGVQVGDAQITDVDYEPQVDTMLTKKITAATNASISKQKLMTAQQEQLTAEAEGKKRLTEIEYQQKELQTKQVVAAETQIELAKRDLIKQQIALEASAKEAAKIKTLADAEAYQKKTIMLADGALSQKLAVYKEVMQTAFKAIGDYKGNWVPLYFSGAGGNNGGSYTPFQMLELLGAKMAKDLMLDLSNK